MGSVVLFWMAGMPFVCSLLRGCVATCAVVNYPGHACSCPQDLVYGDATSKEVIAFLTANQAIPAADKVGGLAGRAGRDEGRPVGRQAGNASR